MPDLNNLTIDVSTELVLSPCYVPVGVWVVVNGQRVDYIGFWFIPRNSQN